MRVSLTGSLSPVDRKLVAPVLATLPRDAVDLLEAREVHIRASSDFPMRFAKGYLGRYRPATHELEISRGTLPGAERAAFCGTPLRLVASLAGVGATVALLAGVAGPVGRLAGLGVAVAALALPAVTALTRAHGGEQTLAHEAVHALDNAMGDGQGMASAQDPEVQACFAEHQAKGDFFTRVAAGRVEEFFAECGTAYLNTERPELPRSRAALAHNDPRMLKVMQHFFEERVPARLRELQKRPS